jgi:hypothetical protein
MKLTILAVSAGLTLVSTAPSSSSVGDVDVLILLEQHFLQNDSLERLRSFSQSMFDDTLLKGSLTWMTCPSVCDNSLSLEEVARVSSLIEKVFL